MRTSARAPAWVFSLVILAACLTAVCSGASMAAPAGTPHLPDLQTVIPASSFSIVNGTDGREFRYTHLVYNAGSGPLEIQPAYDTASGQYRGTQLVYTHN